MVVDVPLHRESHHSLEKRLPIVHTCPEGVRLLEYPARTMEGPEREVTNKREWQEKEQPPDAPLCNPLSLNDVHDCRPDKGLEEKFYKLGHGKHGPESDNS